MSGRLPAWFKQKIPAAGVMADMANLIEGGGLHTICESALCPNAGECFSRKTATFLILGDVCTRHCTFCAVQKGAPLPVDPVEPDHVSEASRSLGLRYAVITSVTRDDLLDGGACQFAGVVEKLHAQSILAEVLVPDFRGAADGLTAVVRSMPEVVNHNVETVPRLYAEVRPGADYARSLGLLSNVKSMNPEIVTKSGLMVGLGESKDELVAVFKDLREARCDLLTIGQYLQPTPHHRPIARFVTPEEFEDLAVEARQIGFKGVASAPLVRSSYHAASMYSAVASVAPPSQGK